jgi:arylsulfatase A-like enzyme
MKRREFIAAGSAVLPAVMLGQERAGGFRRPNILWIMTDQQPADSLSCAGNRNLHTPAMDSIAAAGVRFDLAYCVNPICVPSRTSMATGRMPHETGVTFNTDRFDVRFECIGTRMKKAGYDTGYIGKWHIPMPTDTDEWHGFDTMIEGGTPEFNDTDAVKPMVDFLRKKRSKPFFMVASFVNPHDICEYARKLARFGKREELWNGMIPEAPPPEQCPALPANHEIPDNEPDIIREHQRWLAGAYPVRDWSDGTWRQYRWGLNRLTELVDSHIETLLQTLRDEGMADNTIIVLVSDHGDGNGAHKWNQKTLLYEEPARVPCIVAGPGVAVPGRTDSDHLVSTGLDLVPTFCDYAGIEPPEGVRGKSLRPLVEGSPVQWRNQVVSECDLHRQYGLSGGVFGRMLRTKRYKYIAYSAGKQREQLFDMHKDPGEMNNLAVDPASTDILQNHRERLAAQIKQTNDFFVVPGVSDSGWTLQR